MQNVLALSVCCAASLFVGAAMAQPSVKPPPSTTVAPVTVQGATPKTITARSRAFVQGTASAPNPELGQISRWHEPVCVEVEGLAEAAQALQIKTRIESVAKPWACRPHGGGVKQTSRSCSVTILRA